MPLAKGKSDTIIAKNIATLRREGRPADQGAAIAYSVEEEGSEEENDCGLECKPQLIQPIKKPAPYKPTM